MFREVPDGVPPAQSWRPNPGCPARKRHVVLVIRGVTQLACRLQVANDAEREWMLRATHNSDEVRYPSDRRRSTRVTARCLVRGSPAAQYSVHSWPGSEARNRPPASYPDGAPQAEPSALQKLPAVVKQSASAHAKSAECAEELRSPPTCVVDRFAGKPAPLPGFPLCCL